MLDHLCAVTVRSVRDEDHSSQRRRMPAAGVNARRWTGVAARRQRLLRSEAGLL
jgi:hypothetical protein